MKTAAEWLPTLQQLSRPLHGTVGTVNWWAGAGDAKGAVPPKQAVVGKGPGNDPL